MNDFINEVKDDLKRERFEKIFHNYGKHIIAISIVIVLSVASGSWYKGYKISKFQESGEQYRKAVEQKDGEVIKELDFVIENATDGYKSLAAISKANILFAEGKIEESLNAYDAVAAASSIDPAIRDIANYKAAVILVNQNASRDIVEKRLSGLIKSSGGFNSSAKELMAAYENQNGNKDEAAKLFGELAAAQQISNNISVRAEKALAILNPVSAVEEK